VSWSRAASALLAAAALGAAAGPAPAAAAPKPDPPPTRHLCVDHVTVRDAPYGFAIGYLYRPQKLAVYGHPIDRWVLIRARDGLMGWIPKGALCRPGR
jgi:hypothetical protein